MNKIMILGGGLTGLSAAYHSDAEVYEKESVLGGHGKSHTVDGFIFDEGIHVVHTTDKEVLDLYAEAGVQFVVKPRDAWIQSYGAVTRYPFQANTFGLPVDIVKECISGFIQNPHNDAAHVHNYEEWLRVLYGNGFADRFMIPYAIKFWGVHPRDLMTDWVDIRHPRPSLDEVLEGALRDQQKRFGINSEFRYPTQGGFGAIGAALAKKVGHRMHCGMEVTNVDVQRKQVTFNGKETLSYEQLLSTIPLPRLIACIPDTPAEVRVASSRLRTTSILVVNIAIDRPDISAAHWIYYLEKEFPFFRISFTANFHPSVVRPGTSAIQAEIAYNRETNPLPMSHERMAELVVEVLRGLGFIRSDDHILFTNTFDIPYAYIIHDKDRVPSVRAIHSFLRDHDIHPCGRYGDWGYLWSHDAVVSGRDAVRALMTGRMPHASGGVCQDEQCGCTGEFDK